MVMGIISTHSLSLQREMAEHLSLGEDKKKIEGNKLLTATIKKKNGAVSPALDVNVFSSWN